MPSAFTLCIIVLVVLATLGLPIGLSMIGASVFYLLVAGLDGGQPRLREPLDWLRARPSRRFPVAQPAGGGRRG